MSKKNNRNNKRQLAYELKAIKRYLHAGMVSGKSLGLTYVETLELLNQFRSWMCSGRGEYLEDRLLMLLNIKPGQICIDEALVVFEPLINQLFFKVPRPDKHLLKKRSGHVKVWPLVVTTLLYGFLRSTGRITDKETASIRRSKSTLYQYILPQEIKESLGSVSCIYQGLVGLDLPKLMFISVNVSPASSEEKISRKGFPPTIIYFLQKYKELYTSADKKSRTTGALRELLYSSDD